MSVEFSTVITKYVFVVIFLSRMYRKTFLFVFISRPSVDSINSSNDFAIMTNEFNGLYTVRVKRRYLHTFGAR